MKILSHVDTALQNHTHARLTTFLALFALVLVLPLIVLTALTRQDIRQRASGPTSPPYPSLIALSFSPTSSTMGIGTPFDVQVFVNNSNNISGVDFYVTYNKNVTELVSFLPANNLSNQLINQVDNANGKFHYAAVNTTPVQVNVMMGTLKFKTIAFGSSSLAFVEPVITILGANISLADTNNGTATFVVAAPTAVPTNTPTPTPSPTAVITSTPLPSSTAAPTPTPVMGDATGEGIVDIRDYNIWRDEFLGNFNTKQADFNKDNIVNLLDFAIWRNAFNPVSTPTPQPSSALNYKRIFVTSTVYDGNLGGLTGADAKCQTQATSANLGGTWKAWLSDSQTDAKNRMTQSTQPYKLVAGYDVAANGFSDLLDGALLRAINLSESPYVSINNSTVWTNTQTNGSKFSNDLGMTCNDWLGNGPATLAIVGYSSNSGPSWTVWNQSGQSCGIPARLYCIEQ